MQMNIGIDHGYYAMKTRHFSFPAGISSYHYEPYTRNHVLEYGGKFYVCGTGRQLLQRGKMDTDHYGAYLKSRKFRLLSQFGQFLR